MAQWLLTTGKLWQNGIRRGYRNIWRERDWMTACGALMGIFLLLQLSIFILLGMSSIEALLQSRVSLHIEIFDTATDQEVQTFLSNMQALPAVEKMVYVTKEQAYAKMKDQDPELITFVEDLHLENPFPDTVSVTLQSLGQYDTFSKFLQEKRWYTIVDPTFLSQKTDQESYVYELLGLTRVGRSATILFIILTGGILLFITTVLVRERILRRSEEVLVEHLSGAFVSTIRLPFATEATILLFAAVLGSLLLFAGIVGLLHLSLPALTGETLQQLRSSMISSIWRHAPIILLLEMLAVPALGWVGTWLGTLLRIHSRALVLHRQ